MLRQGDNDGIVRADRFKEFPGVLRHTIGFLGVAAVDRQIVGAEIQIGDFGAWYEPGSVVRELAVDVCGAG